MANGASNTAAGLLCPACRVNLVMSERQGIEIDYCPNCRGVWLDRGELDKIIERSATELGAQSPPVQPPMARPPMPPQAYDSRRDHDRDYDRDRHEGYKKHKRRSFLEDLFD